MEMLQLKHLNILRIAFIILTVLIAGLTTYGQYASRNNDKKYDADYNLMMKDYDKALKEYLDVLKSEPDNADVKYKIGICYLNSENDKSKAIPYLEDAVKHVSKKYNPNSFKETDAPADAYFILGSAYRVTNQLDKAVEAYKKFREYIDPKDTYNLQLTDDYINSCYKATSMMQKPVNVRITNLGSDINKDKSNFNAVVSGDGQTLVYTSPGKIGYEVYFSKLVNGVWTTPKNITSMLGNMKYLETSCLSYDGYSLYLVFDDPVNSDIYVSNFKKGKWSKAVPLDKPINTKDNETHASISADEKTLYFTSNRKGGEGDMDIYKATLDKKGNWGKPVNLGPVINTPYNEETPFVTADGNTLFFSSEGHEGMGGYDVYKYDFTNPSAGVINLGYPINTTDNDLFFVPLNDGSSGYFSRTAPDSYGKRAIYYVEILPPQIQNIILQGQITSDVNPGDQFINNFNISVINSSSLDTVIKTKPIDNTGDYTCELKPGNYTLAIEADHYTPFTKQVSIPEDYTGTEMTVNASMAYIQQQKPAEEQPLANNTVQASVPEFKQVVQEPVVTQKQTVKSSPKTKPENIIRDKEPESYFQPVGNGEIRSYTIQIMALKKPVDLNYFKNLDNISVTYSSDQWYRYTWGITTDAAKAEQLRNTVIQNGYKDVFIRKKQSVPNFTIQLMAVPGPVIDLTTFKDLPNISATIGKDRFCRYTTGEFETKEEAIDALEKIKQMGYTKAFVKKL